MTVGLRAGIAALARSWRARGGLLLIALIALAGWGSPLTNHLGFAASLVAALCTSMVCAIVGAGVVASLRSADVLVSGGALATIAGGFATLALALFAVVTASHGLLGPSCSPGHGALFFLVGAWPGAVLAALIGTVVGAVIHRRRWPTVIAALLVPASIAWALVRFYRSPAVFMYDPFFGFFPGTLYDETIRLGATMVTYRLGTAGAIVAVAAFLVAGWSLEDGTFSVRRARRDVPALGAAGAGALVAVGVYLAGPALGHRYSSGEVADALGGRIDGRRCTVLYARSIDGRHARLMRDDCEIRLRQDEAYFGLPAGERVTVFLFADADQKRRYMGAAETYVAKPWRREVYLQYAGFPHPVLKHEIAHVVAGAMASGPFHVSVRAGVLPLPGLIEGAAVAAAWEGDSDASPHQWSRAMLEAGLLPSMRELTGLSFLLNASETAYTAAGSFSHWLVQRYGAERYRRVYADGNFGAAYGRSLGALEDEWRAFLHTVDTPERLLVRARTRFHRAPLQARVCPHETAELLDRARMQLAAGDVSEARAALTRVVAYDPTEVGARADLAEALAREQQVPRAIELAESATRDLGPAAGARARLRVADVLWRWDSAASARALLETLSPDLFDEDEARTLEVKRWVLGMTAVPVDPDVAERVRDLLVGRGDRRADALPAVAGLLSIANRGDASAAFTAYTVGRQLLGHDRAEQAVAVLTSLHRDSLPTERMRAEARKLLAVAQYEAGMTADARAGFVQISEDPTRPQGIRDAARDWVDRIDRESVSARP